MNTPIVTKQTLQLMLDTGDTDYVIKVVGRALVVLYNNQTDDEKSINRTKHQNGRGFAQCDSHSGSLTAKYFLANKKLEKWQLSKWLKRDKKGYSRLTKYHSQLNDVAMKKMVNK